QAHQSRPALVPGLGGEPSRLASDHQLLVGRDHPYLDRARADEAFAAAGLGVQLGVERETAPAHALADLRAHVGRVLADAAGEAHGAGATERGQVRAEILLRAIAEHLDGQPRARVARASLDQVAHVTRPSGDAGEPGTLVEPALDLVDGRVLALDELADQ